MEEDFLRSSVQIPTKPSLADKENCPEMFHRVFHFFISESIFEVSLIDNVYSDIARLRGFYGQLVVEGKEVITVV